MIDRHDIDLIAAEYVLGTLNAEQRRNVDRNRVSDEELENAILRWEQDLSPLNEMIQPVQPDESVEVKLNARLDEHISASNKSESLQSNTISYQKLANRWRMMALASSFIAACLAIILVFRPQIEQTAPQEYLAVFQENDQQPAFLMTIDLSNQKLSIVPVTAEEKTNKSYQLWIVANDIGPNPQSLGLLDSIQKPTLKTLDEFDAEILKTATFGISVEPVGGSPTGKPTGTAMHGTLYPFSTPSSK